MAGDFASKTHEMYRMLRETAPVYWSPFLNQWLVTSAELVEEVLLSPGVYSNYGFDTAYIGRLNDDSIAPTLRHHYQQRGLIQADPPDHTRLRRTLSQHFTTRSLQPLGPAIDETVTGLLGSASEDFDVIRDLAGPLPVAVIAELLGVPEGDRGGFPQWSSSAVRFFGTPQPETENARCFDQNLIEWRSLLFRLLEDRRSHPASDLLTRMAEHVRLDDMSLEEALFTAVHLLIAGHETTTNLIGNSVYCLLTHPEALFTVQLDPNMLELAIEEVLRFEPPIQRIRRVAVQDTLLGDREISTGQAVIPVLASANRDSSRYVDPDSFDIHRDLTNPHLAFGRGVHFCIGARLGRMEAVAALGALIERFPTIRLPEHFVPAWRNTINLRGLEALPIRSEGGG